jgi:flagellar biosynthetic protein FliR
VSLDLTTAISFVLILCRTTAWTMTLPGIGGKGVSAFGRLALSLSLAMFLVGALPAWQAPTDTTGLLAAAVTETLIGLTLGWMVMLAVAGIEASGVLIDFFGGFSAASVFDPASGHQAAIFARLQTVLLGLLIVVSPALHGLIRGFALSYKQVPLGTTPDFNAEIWTAIASATSNILVAAVAIAAPVLGALLLAEAGMALASRFVPQANVFFLGLPIKALITLSVAGVSLTLVPTVLPRLLEIGDQLGRQTFGG